ncbi:hypothetical protein NXS19_000893 [Fusarium pseudograminearum]|uniref:Uncharacterized protein n=2 Tax=Fusarium pseudograminearum TaxID=101028 RepID=K3VS16_FUSPC|nr:hypothetical protein FPSE_01396 [Fusarium pseudograminearum CS3096]EKJ78422.1 hypothetical protein FPSE_01396 [Fusarium pseudograminearum CS3096]KAF0634981.1 hypothetical protein FPSE5266_01396 [Fusarium pseudograminearum]UZP33077.1 hypothetical protein NXS19_000893 [Fusarium pseudograminearum]CEG02604.1 unnamed protein product [Fusarium pseudograminearum CS3487]
MCQKVETVCCHCGEILITYFIACNAWLVAAKQTSDDNGRPLALPLASQCEHLEKKEPQSSLLGCPNNDSCPSWFGNLFRCYDKAASEGPEVKQFRDRVAQGKYNEWKENFARKHFVKKPVLPRQEQNGFWNMISQDFLSDIQSAETVPTASVSSGGETTLKTYEVIMQSEDENILI